ncbi:hypothetical protein [Beijerinckia sp. L45]|uniref:hypothetical protein n=1 Tax=Beijerinckia sp. L45 TaxID=1641855 RepID=UPI00131C92D3|nr:hypothetical protein [Beijerinckia sp. L45]
MTSRLKFFAAAALGLVLATGTLADVSAKTVTTTHAATTHIGKTHTAMTHHTRIATKGHRLHVAHLRHAHKLHVAHHKTGHHLVKATGAKGTKDAGVTHRERHADNRRVAGKPASVIR